MGAVLSNAHAHLRGDVASLVQGARDRGVDLILTAGIDLQSSKDAVTLAQRFDRVYACVGIHPWNADQFDQRSLPTLRALAREPRVVAISEIGLDFVSRRDPNTWSRGDPLPRDVQTTAFQHQVRLAREVQRPIILHEHQSHAETLAILTRERAADVGGIVHGFRGNLTFAQECLDLGFHISVGRAVLTPENAMLHDAVKAIPIERLLTETDGGDPADVTDVVEKVAALKRISVEAVGRTSTATLTRLMRI